MIIKIQKSENGDKEVSGGIWYQNALNTYFIAGKDRRGWYAVIHGNEVKYVHPLDAEEVMPSDFYMDTNIPEDLLFTAVDCSSPYIERLPLFPYQPQLGLLLRELKRLRKEEIKGEISQCQENISLDIGQVRVTIQVQPLERML